MYIFPWPAGASVGSVEIWGLALKCLIGLLQTNKKKNSVFAFSNVINFVKIHFVVECSVILLMLSEQ